jgi:hypothetical protein
VFMGCSLHGGQLAGLPGLSCGFSIQGGGGKVRGKATPQQGISKEPEVLLSSGPASIITQILISATLW